MTRAALIVAVGVLVALICCQETPKSRTTSAWLGPVDNGGIQIGLYEKP